MVKVRDWLVGAGGEFDELSWGSSDMMSVTLDDTGYFFTDGASGASDEEIAVEIAGLASNEGFAPALVVRALLADRGISEGLPRRGIAVEVDLAGDGSVWVSRQFSRCDIDGPLFDTFMCELVEITEVVRSAATGR